MAESKKEEGNDVTIESLQQQLKETKKELSRNEKKLKKVEEKFFEMHETKKLLTSDRDTFLNFLQLVFTEDTLQEVLLPDDRIGTYDIEHLRQFWLH